MKLTTLFLLWAISCAFCVNPNVYNMLVSFVTMDDRSTSVLLFHLCWTSHEIKSLVKSLFEVNINIAHSVQKNKTGHFLQHILLVADLSCAGIETHLIQANTEGYVKAPYRWLLLCTQEQDILPPLDALVDSDVVIASTADDMEYMFIEAYKISKQSEFIYNTRATWRSKNIDKVLESSNENFLITFKDKHSNTISNKTKNRTISKYGTVIDYRESKVLSSRRMNLRRHALTMVNVINDSNETKKHLDDRLQLHWDSITKMSYMVAKLCLDALNSTENLVFTNTWGYRDKNGNWQGVIDFLIKKKADIGTGMLFIAERLDVVDYIAPAGSTALRFVFREPPLAYITNIFTLPFSGTVWLAIFICILACALFLYIASKWEASMGMHPLQLDGTWADVLILIIGAILQQGCTLEPRYAAGRCATLLLFIALTILYAAYSANIVVLLRAPSSSIKTVQDLLDSPLKLGASDFPYNRYFFMKWNDPIRKAIYDKKIAPKGQKPNYLSMEEGIERIRQGLFAFHMEVYPGYRIIQETYQENEKCDLVEIDYLNEQPNPWLPGQKGSPFKELFKINFQKIREMGLETCIRHRLYVPRPRCSGTVSTFSSVGITDMYPAMLATLYGMLMAPAVLMLEIAYKKLTTLRKNENLRMEHRQSVLVSFED
ncbi:probable glutamate receptor [Hyposmocoma kahamanoa]|uniref:probable glutamate receptor n=1 Tax=Hyposmocoma kahamanoa TaxID=1477025 RepID=UPI000E6D5E15|nr:probable glutamate receptor [Hyposmocoma kahamanoa]